MELHRIENETYADSAFDTITDTALIVIEFVQILCRDSVAFTLYIESPTAEQSDICDELKMPYIHVKMSKKRNFQV